MRKTLLEPDHGLFQHRVDYLRSDDEIFMSRYRERVVRMMEQMVEEKGFTTHREIIDRYLEIQDDRLNMTTRYTFPRPPRVDDPARLCGGPWNKGSHPATGPEIVVDALVRDEHGQLIGEGYYFQTDKHRYQLDGLNVATGEWVFGYVGKL